MVSLPYIFQSFKIMSCLEVHGLEAFTVNIGTSYRKKMHKCEDGIFFNSMKK